MPEGVKQRTRDLTHPLLPFRILFSGLVGEEYGLARVPEGPEHPWEGCSPGFCGGSPVPAQPVLCCVLWLGIHTGLVDMVEWHIPELGSADLYSVGHLSTYGYPITEWQCLEQAGARPSTPPPSIKT